MARSNAVADPHDQALVVGVRDPQESLVITILQNAKRRLQSGPTAPLKTEHQRHALATLRLVRPEHNGAIVQGLLLVHAPDQGTNRSARLVEQS